MRTPRSASRDSHARTSGVARNDRGTPPARPDERGLPEARAPVAQVGRAEHVEDRCEPVGRARVPGLEAARSSLWVRFSPP